MKKVLCILLLWFGIAGGLYAQNEEDIDYILVLNSINFNEVKTRLLFETIRDEFTSDHVEVVSESLGLKLVVKEEALAVPSLQSLEEVNSKIHYLREKYSQKRRPLALLFIGDPGWLLCKPLFDDIWKDVPTVISMARDRMAPDISIMLDKDEIRLKKELKPTQEVLKPYNVVALKQPVFIKETVELMRKLMPDMDKIAFVSDQRYISLFTRIELKDTLNTYFPDIKLQELTSPQLNTQDLLDTLSMEKNHTGLIYFSWFVPMRKSIDTYLDDNIQTIVSAFSKSPVFTLADLNPETGGFAGGHYINVKSLAKTCIDVLYRILDGEQPRNIPFMMGGTPATILNYTHLSHYNIPVGLFPSEAVYVQAPPSFWEKSKWTIITLVVILSLIVIIIVMRIRSYALRQRARERKIQMLKDNKLFLEDLFNNLSVAVAVRDLQDELHFLYWNKEAENLFGLTRKEVMENMDLALASNEMTKEMNRNDLEILQQNGRFSGLCKFKKQDGGPLSLYVSKRTISHPDGRKWLLITAWDMTEQQQNIEKLGELNKRLQMVMEVSQMSLWTYDIKKDVITYDGINSLPEILPTDNQCNLKDFLDLISPEMRNRVCNSVFRFLHGDMPSLHEEFTLYKSFSRRLDNPIWLCSHSTVLKYDAEGKPVVLVGANKDISAQKELEDTLLKAKKAAEEASRLKDVFLANMSHEIRTPLNSIVGFSSLLAETEDPSEQTEYSKIIQNNTDLLLQLINDILDLSKIEAGTMEFTYKDVNVYNLFAELEKTTRWRMKDSNVDIIFEESCPEVVLNIDPNRFMQVINNFMTNAIKFTHQGSIHFGYRQQENKDWYFYLTDTGEGIPSEKVHTVFDRFVKLDAFKQGTGLGLSICKSIIDRFEGEIGADSQLGAGSTFWFTLPEKRLAKSNV
ncbi:ABC transporter substrate binding protein [Phocaeicola sp.]